MKIQLIDPQPSKRLLPYADPVNGLFWAETEEHPYESPRWVGPKWLNYACVQLKEINGTLASRINKDGGLGWNCYGPGCPTGEDGCNAKGCYGEREQLIKDMGGNADLWVWIEIFPKEPSE